MQHDTSETLDTIQRNIKLHIKKKKKKTSSLKQTNIKNNIFLMLCVQTHSQNTSNISLLYQCFFEDEFLRNN